jgi:hypothetical protein
VPETIIADTSCLIVLSNIKSLIFTAVYEMIFKHQSVMRPDLKEYVTGFMLHVTVNNEYALNKKGLKFIL